MACILHIKPRSMVIGNFNVIQNKNKILIDEMSRFYNYMSFTTKWVK
jgi:hypothetical protein